ncbi:hypothetical protein SK128_023550, partial [Halocaridina rubra]
VIRSLSKKQDRLTIKKNDVYGKKDAKPINYGRVVGDGDNMGGGGAKMKKIWNFDDDHSQ